MDKTDWKPSKKIIESSNIYKMMQHYGFDEYQDLWKWSVTNKEAFWKATVKNLEIKLAQNYTSIVDTSKGVENAAWFKKCQIKYSRFLFSK